MTSSEKWNFIVDRYKQLYSQPEEKVQAEWETYCAELFEYKKILHEIDAQRHIKVGSGGAFIPDIILQIDGNDIFDIELKQYSLLFDEAFETQLISYLNQIHLSAGMIVCSKIYLYYYEYATHSINKIEIPFETNNSDGIALMEMITKDTFLADRIKEYILTKIRHERTVSEIKKTITDDWITIAIKSKLKEQYSESDVEEALKDYSFKVIPPSKTPNPPGPPNSDNPPVNDISPVIHEWCRKKMQEGEINFLQNFSGKKFTRFTTSDLDGILPYQNNVKSGWNNGHFYSYEIVNDKEQFKMWIVFNNKNAPAAIRQVFSKIMRASDSRPQKDDWQWWTIFSTSNYTYNENTTPDEIKNELESQFNQVHAKVIKMLERIYAMKQ